MSAASGGPQRRARRQWYASRFSFLRGVRTHARSICLVGFWVIWRLRQRARSRDFFFVARE